MYRHDHLPGAQRQLLVFTLGVDVNLTFEPISREKLQHLVLYVFREGLRSDLGSALKSVDVSGEDWYSRVGYDVSYFLLVTTVPSGFRSFGGAE